MMPHRNWRRYLQRLERTFANGCRKILMISGTSHVVEFGNVNYDGRNPDRPEATHVFSERLHASESLDKQVIAIAFYIFFGNP